MTKDINRDVFSEETKLKLDIFRECFREWFPVFLHNPYISRIYIYDLFAGSGKDAEGTFGSPLILVEEAKGNEKQHCRFLNRNGKPLILFGFNEKLPKKKQLLEENVSQEISNCQLDCDLQECVFKHSCYFESKDFKELIQNKNVLSALENNDYGKFILLDQYGFKQITDDVFIKLINSPKTDFIFFIASSFIKRFRDEPSVNMYFNKENISFDKSKPKECHRAITDYFKSLIPPGKEYFLHSFTIQKGANYYGLIFGSNHSLGMEKFLKVCWKEDPFAGESNCNINNDFGLGTLFHNPEATNKIKIVKNKISKLILAGEISDNICGLKYSLNYGCKPSLYVDVVSELLSQKKITIDGEFNKTATNIHKAKLYKIKIL
nr:three-Cys-motif partner protein TcmP [uncultured Bacteroides sp.]